MNISTISRSVFSAITYAPNAIFAGAKSLASRVSSFAGSCFSKIGSIFSRSTKVTPLAPSRVTAPQAPVATPVAPQAPVATPVTPQAPVATPVAPQAPVATPVAPQASVALQAPKKSAREESIASLTPKQRAIFNNLRATKNVTLEQRQNTYLTKLGKEI